MVIDPDPEDEIIRQARRHRAALYRLTGLVDLHQTFFFFIGAVIHPGITVGYRNTSIRPDPGDAPASVDKIDEVGEERGLFFLPGAPMQPVIPGHAEIGSLPEDAIGPGD